jgi:hypothetical protein
MPKAMVTGVKSHRRQRLGVRLREGDAIGNPPLGQRFPPTASILPLMSATVTTALSCARDVEAMSPVHRRHRGRRRVERRAAKATQPWRPPRAVKAADIRSFIRS